MLIQGSNNPIRFIFEETNDMPDSMIITLSNEISVLRTWSTPEITIDYEGHEASVQVTQDESMEWEPGPCKIEAKIMDGYGNTIFATAYDTILPWKDKTVLEV